MREAWAADFRERAERYWDDARLEQLIGGKQLPITPRTAPILLRALGLLNRDASLPPTRVRKFRQVNHMLLVLRPALRELASQHETIRVIDAGCGRSYLSMAVAWWFRSVSGRRIELLGIDRNPDVIGECRRRTDAAELSDSLRYAAMDLADLSLSDTWTEVFGSGCPELHGLISLHACDTATDDALAIAIRHRARFIAVAPCCQAELAAGWARLAEAGVAGSHAPIWNSPHLRRTTAATVTDAMRTLLLEHVGYSTSATEFVEATHTPKNTLIRANLREPDAEAWGRYQALKAATGGIGIALEERIGDPTASCQLPAAG